MRVDTDPLPEMSEHPLVEIERLRLEVHQAYLDGYRAGVEAAANAVPVCNVHEEIRAIIRALVVPAAPKDKA